MKKWERGSLKVKFFNREKARSRSFEEITTPIDEQKTVDEEHDKNVESPNEKKPNGVPFDSNEFGALSCFGWKEQKTDKWLIKSAKVWFLIMSFAWFLFGAITFAPILFISNKVDVLFNDRKKSLIFGTIIHVVIIALIVLLFASRRDNLDLPIA
jgi:hypothetical protein